MASLDFLLYIPVSTVTILVNIFLIFCMCFQEQGTEHLKQPLNVLLGTLVGCNITFHVCIFLFSIVNRYSGFLVYVVIEEILFLTMKTSATSSLWLNVFYYYQIVPAQYSVFIYLKRNIRLSIYSFMIAEKIFFLFGFSENIAFCAFFDQLYNSEFFTTQWNETSAKLDRLYDCILVDTWLRCGYLLLCLCVMLTSSCATILYLRKHVKSIEGSSSSFSSPRLQRQMRVTLTGIIQTFLFFLCLVWMIVRELFELLGNQNIDFYSYIGCTVVCLYSFGTTINLCVGQTIFRNRVFKVWQKCRQTVTLLSN
ncbi:taste receptor type 2 member 114-like [Pangasianodon hypophthalmus]|uniref:taste receptor type 2 member 114-like n=1 Tax=Pangasianodon hypophthalmus TaxID=310915 RepID=UPI0023078826|nr:taste receptor type 2 member 114-like [Pangasianodon hypophthalmus]